MNRRSCAIDPEQRRRVERRSRHLRVIAAGDELFSGFAGKLRCAAGMSNFVREDRADERLGRLIAGVEHHDAVIARQSLDPARERVGHTHARLIRVLQIVEQLRGELGRWERGRKLLDRGVDVLDFFFCETEFNFMIVVIKTWTKSLF